MNRREAIERITLMMGGVLAAPILAGAMGEKLNTGPSIQFTPKQEQLIADVADVIIPTTKTPGAKAAGVEKFISRVVSDCYTLNEQEAFYSELAKFDTNSKAIYGKEFSALTATQQHDIVKRATTDNKPFFLQIKGLTVTAYFISEIGATQALEYLPIPGRFEGTTTLASGQKTWAL